MKLTACAMLAVLTVVGATPFKFQDTQVVVELSEWELFKDLFNKTYNTPEEETLRRKIFEENKRRINEHNEEYFKGWTSFSMGLNHFSDMLPEEINTWLGQEIIDEQTYGSLETGYFKVPKNVSLPSSVDWRLKGAVTHVRNQKHCGSCWAFSSIGVMEGQHFRKTGKLVALSEQNLIDCVTDNHGCNAGIPHRAFDYARTHGVDTEESYPYEEKAGACRSGEAQIGARNVGAFLRVPKGDEETLKAAVALAGPVLVSIDSKHPSFHGYKGGVFYEKNCSKTETHHAVLVVGYGTDKGHDYWIVKNSWGDHWGEHGYVRMSRNRGNNCNIAKFPLVPVV